MYDIDNDDGKTLFWCVHHKSYNNQSYRYKFFLYFETFPLFSFYMLRHLGGFFQHLLFLNPFVPISVHFIYLNSVRSQANQVNLWKLTFGLFLVSTRLKFPILYYCEFGNEDVAILRPFNMYSIVCFTLILSVTAYILQNIYTFYIRMI